MSTKDYGRKLYLSDKPYQEQMRSPSDKAIYDQAPMPQSEFKKPYAFPTYEEMESAYENPPGWDLGPYTGGDGFPWMDMPDIPSLRPDAAPSIDGPEWDTRGAGPARTPKDKGKSFKFDESPCYCPGQQFCATVNGVVAGTEVVGGGVIDSVEARGSRICFTPRDDAMLDAWVTVMVQAPGELYPHRQDLIIPKCDGQDGDKCGPSCDCTGISIGYTSTQMITGDTQTLSVVGAVAGGTYSWAIASGGGSLSAATGTSVDYTAPATNADCADNATITLSVGGLTCATLALGITDATYAGFLAYTLASGPVTCGAFFKCRVHRQGYSCDGNIYAGYGGDDFSPSCSGSVNCTVPPPTGACPGPLEAVCDIRAPGLKAAGCCPAALL